MIQAFFFDLQRDQRRRLAPDGLRARGARKVGVLGAGMMGAGIAYVCAQAGIEVVLKDVTARGRREGQGVLARAGREGRRARARPPQEKATRCSRGSPRPRTPPTLAGCDLVIEAVFEDPALKHKVFARGRGRASPRTRCSARTPPRCRSPRSPTASRGPADFIGLHFFSPVDKMPLVEIIRGEQTSRRDAGAGRFDVARQIGKTPIVVNDSRGFFTSRVIGTFLNEGVAMLAEGIAPPSIEQAGAAGRLPGAGRCS